MPPTTPPPPPSEPTRHRLQRLRASLLRLHKRLLEREHHSYERIYGPVSRGQLFHLVLNEPGFAWLRPLSQLIAAIDEAHDTADPPLTEAGALDLFVRTRELLRPAEAGAGFEKSYFDALQDDAEVILLHRDVTRLLAEPR